MLGNCEKRCNFAHRLQAWVNHAHAHEYKV